MALTKVLITVKTYPALSAKYDEKHLVLAKYHENISNHVTRVTKTS